jgi:ABC-type branched-subunit amino acid transport system substrate-binding protein
MLKNGMKVAMVAAAIGLLATACSSTSSGTSSGSASSTTYTVGLLSDLTGLAASGNKTSVQGVEAGIAWAADQGYKINYDVADTMSSPTGVVSAAQKLVLEDHVFAVVSVSSLTTLAADYMTSHNVPVVGVAEDGTEWITAKNMFSSFGPIDSSKVATTYGDFFKSVGVTNFGSLGYGISPLSAQAAKGASLSAQHAGLKVGYENSNFPFGSTNVAPVALAMKSAGVNGFVTSTDPNTGLELVTASKQAGVDLKAALLPTGYGGDLTQAGPGALQSAQGVYFLSTFEPVEMHTAATTQFQNYLKKVGVTGDPTYAEYAGYTSIVLLVDGLKAAGSHPTQASLIKGLSSLTAFNAAGLLGSRSVDMAAREASPVGPGNCIYVTKLSGSNFELVSGDDPLCGTVIPGLNAST